MSYALRFSKSALEDIERHKNSGDRATIKKIEKLLNELREHPATGTGQPEKLRHDLTGLYSRRINKKHRLIYSIHDSVVIVHILSAWSHHDDR